MKSGQSLVTQLYFATSAKYRKLKARVDKSIQSGRFKKLSQRKRTSLLAKLKRLYKRLRDLHLQLKLAGATAAFSLVTSFGASAQTPGPFVQNDAANPLPAPYRIEQPRVAVVDIDGDGDLDIFTGNYDGDIQFFRNNNGAGPLTSVKRFTEVTGSGNPLSGVNKGQYAAPAFVDVDGDGDFDMLLGVNNPNYDGGTGYSGYDYYPKPFFFRNTGSATNPIFVEETGASNPFDGAYGPKYGVSIPVFVDIDGDTDLDLFIGGRYSNDLYGPNDAANYYENNGGVFTRTSHNLTGYLSDNSFRKTSMTFADLDLNGELDVIFSDGYGDLRCFIEASSEYNEQTGLWDPVDKSGNPMHNFYMYKGSPVFADFDGDGDLDLIVGQASNSRVSVQYFENTDGAFSFGAKNDLNISPMGGVDVGREASPQFMDLDGDGDLDAIIGAKYNYGSIPEIFVFIRDEDGDFVADQDHPIVQGLDAVGYGYPIRDIIPIVVDIDNDGDIDLIICRDDDVLFLKNEDGDFINQPSLFPSFNSTNASELSLTFIDMDNDNDLDALFGNEDDPARIEYFENQANPSNPSAVQVPNFISAAPPAPFDALTFGSNPNPNITAIDLDNDGDRDIVIAETYYFQSGYNGYRTKVRYFENNGDGTFTEGTTPVGDQFDALSYINFADIDGDGDLDGFIGTGYLNLTGGQVLYFENTNPAPTPALATTTLSYKFGTGPIVVDANLTLADADGDNIIRATVSIQNFQPGNETLTFNPQAPVTASFNTTTGVLTLQGKATLAVYQAILRTVSYNYTGPDPGTRKRTEGRTQSLSRTVAFRVTDQDNTAGQPASRTINIASDPPPPVINNPPVITASTLTTVINNRVTIDLTTIITDPDGNLDPLSFKVIDNVLPTPGRRGNASIANNILTVDYAGTDFAGTDFVTIEACDSDMLCAAAELTIEVEGDIIVRNGFSPNGDPFNPFFRIDNITSLGAENKVSIFNRWGDRVFEIDNYNNADRKFDGKSDGGKELPSGVYFYKIEFKNGRPELSGYVTLKR